jgi:Uma2 family endonuclease
MTHITKPIAPVIGSVATIPRFREEIHSGITFFPDGDSESVRIPHSAGNFDGFRAWALSESFPQRGQFTFVGGELMVDMSPESLEEHNQVKTEVCRVLANLVRAKKLGRLYIDGVLISHAEAGVSNEPDALFVSKQTRESGRLTFTPERGRPQSSKEIVGSVDWVMEIVSPSSRRKDKILLRSAYFSAGIPEYWLIDVLGDDIDFQILVPGDNEYTATTPVDGWKVSNTFGCSFKLSRDKDSDGLWEYTLQVREET